YRRSATIFARRRRDELRGGGSGTAAQRIRRWPCGRAPAAARIEGDVGPMVAAADEAWLLSDVTQMVPVAGPARCSNGEHAVVDAAGLITSRTGHLWLVPGPRLHRCGTLADGSFIYST